MTRDDQERINDLDREWDAHLDGHGHDPLIYRLHAHDDAPAPSRHFRQRLEELLRSNHTAQSSSSGADQNSVVTEPPPATRLADVDQPITHPSTWRKWGELAAIVVFLCLAIVGAALYGDEAYDFAQQQFASETDDDDTTDDETRETLQEDGAVSGLTFDEAQAVTPMQLTLPDISPDMLSEPRFTVFASASQTSKPERVWPLWSAEATYEATDDLPPVQIRYAPAWSPGGHGIPLPSDIGRHEDAPEGAFEVVAVSEQHVLRSIELTDAGGAVSHFLWRQGDLAITLSAPVWTDLNEEQTDWIDMPETSLTYEAVEAMIVSLLEHGQLDDGAEYIASRNLLLEKALEWSPTAPFPESVPEPLELRRADANPNGPTLYLNHPEDSVLGIWLHSLAALGTTMPGGTVHGDLRETLGADEIDVGGVPVTRLSFSDRDDPDLAEFLLITRDMTLLLSWISGVTDTALVVYLWEIAGMSFVLGIEVDSDSVASEDGESTFDVSHLPEGDWLALIEEQRLIADQTLDPEEVFPELAREATEEEEQLLEDSDRRDPILDQIESIRLIGEQEGVRFYIGLTGNQHICTITTVATGGEELTGASGCSPLWNAADVGLGSYSSGGDRPAVLAYILPSGYDAVVNADGEVIAQVENQLVAMVFESGESRPRDLIARGPAGELLLGVGASARSQSVEQPAIEFP